MQRSKWASQRCGFKIGWSGFWPPSATPPLQLSLWIQELHSLCGLKERLSFQVHAVEDAEMQVLNRRHRGKDAVTNVLAFPWEGPRKRKRRRWLGEIAVAPQWLLQEALSLGRAPNFHLTHLVTHGLLHLLGYDHIEPAMAEEMETLESCALKGWGFPDPYDSVAPEGEVEGRVSAGGEPSL